MTIKTKIEDRLKQRKDELQTKQKYLAELNNALEKVNNEIRSTREVIVFLTGAIQEAQDFAAFSEDEEEEKQKI